MKKVLIVTYYWPPAGGPGVQRWLKFVKYLPEFGIEPIVYIPDNPHYPIIDEDLVNQVAESVTILRHKIIEPYTVASIFSKKKVKQMSAGILMHSSHQSLIEKLALWVRGNLFIPDARVLWVRPSVRILKKYIREHNIETLITTGPPHSLHLIGLALKKNLPLKWIADFRDPWTTIGYQKELRLSEKATEKHRRLEEEVLLSADEILVTSPTTASDFSDITTKPIHLITNGYDVESVVEKPLDAKFSIAHIGSLLSERNPKLLWTVLSEMIHEIPGFGNDLEIKLIGTISNQVLESLEIYSLKPYLKLPGYMSHELAIAEQRCSQVLLLVEINSLDTKSIIPGKLFEYMVSGRPIVAIGPAGSDFAEIIKETNSGKFVDYGGKEELKKVLTAYYDSYLAGDLKSNAIGLQKYSRRNLTAELARLI
ncbi:glycosyltransferase family 4 protein [Flavobacterium silvaticum]|uniref:Glycosyltransferase family 4 protein n=1 Tax=Flavobacterium silvaticum TaxID=1852020 RepID=A0A972JF25_9FLAO|nr:glycosyltransferase family 4 protein [Flavobacterium silvaticum]NMH26786.1 glycosyltransferase family 4 protein [Flavobacterium silvaticum]